MHTCVESVFPLPPMEPALGGHTRDADREVPPECEEAAGSSDAPPRTSEGTRWSAWTWLGLQKKKEKTGSVPVRAMVHVGVDAFFASVEQVLDPRLCGKPVLVGRPVVASASHEARLCGVKTGMTIGEALRICPDATAVAGHYSQYADFAERLRRILESYTPAVETAALDDFYLDFGTTEPSFGELRGVLLRMQMEVLKKTGLRISIGAARSRAVASAASRLERPRGLRIVRVGQEREFLASLSADQLPGIDQAEAKLLAAGGVTTIGELQLVPRPALERALGERAGRQVWERARGCDEAPPKTPVARQEVSREIAFPGGTTDREFLGTLVGYLGERVNYVLSDRGQRPRTAGVRIRYANGLSMSQTAEIRSSRDAADLVNSVREIFAELFSRGGAVDRIGVTAGALQTDVKLAQTFDRKTEPGRSVGRNAAPARPFRAGWVISGTALGFGGPGKDRLAIPAPCLSR